VYADPAPYVYAPHPYLATRTPFSEILNTKLSQYNTATASSLAIARKQALPGSGFENIIYALACQGGAFEVLLRRDSFPDILALFGGEEFLAALAHLFLRVRILTKIFLEPDKDDGDAWTALDDFGMPELSC